MSNALEAASLIMVPSGYEDGTLASVKPNDGTGDFTFSRGSNLSATRINEQGYIEKGYENLFLQSNSFDATWTTFGASVTSGQSGYDGSNDAWLLEKTSANGYLNQSNIDNGLQTFSIYAKANESNFLYVRIYADSPRVFFDLINGVTTNSGPVISSSIEDVGNGWYRCSFSTNMTSASFLRIYPAEAAFDSSATSGSIYIQDAMLNQGLAAYTYIETTTAPVAGGILEDTPRLDWASGAPSLLLEPSRTNLWVNSEYLSPTKDQNTGSSVIQNTSETLSPEGLYNASKLSGVGNWIWRDFIAVQNVTSTVSCYAKAVTSGANNTFRLSIAGQISDDLTATNEWQRFSYTALGPAQATGLIYDSAGNDADLYIYGFQAEQDATYPTSYIPTYGVSQTRLGDDISTLDFSSILGNDSYTIFLDVETENIGSSTNVAGDIFYLSVGSQTLAIDTRVSVIQDDSSSTTRIKVDVGDDITHYKAALKVTPTSATIFGNGIEGQSGTSRGLSPTSFNFYYNNKLKYNKILFFPTALSDEECIQLTTI